MQKINSPYAWTIDPKKYKKDNNKVVIFDTTLRDGEQSPGAALNAAQKIRLSKYLVDLGVDAIEAGFPISSPEDFKSVMEIAKNYADKDIAVFGLARAIDRDIIRAYEAVRYAKLPGIHTFIATSDEHIKKKFPGKTKKDILEIIEKEVSHARELLDGLEKPSLVEFSPEDAGRTKVDYLYKVCETAIEAGANIINMPDTVGYKEPEEFGKLISGIIKNVKNIGKVILSVHCHNDLGLASANSLSAVKNGALQVECTVNGIGERAGNASLEEIVMALNTRKDLFNKKTNIATTRLYNTSKTVAAFTGYHPQRNKAIIGSNAFAHEAGIHQDGMIKSEKTYEIITPQTIGLKFNKKSLGSRSGKNALFERLRLLNYDLNSEERKERIYDEFIKIADTQRKVTDMDLIYMMKDLGHTTNFVLPLEFVDLVYAAKGKRHKAKLIMNYYGKRKTSTDAGNGPVDAAFNAMKKILGNHVDILTYNSNSVGVGSDSTARAEITIKLEGDLITGDAYSTDIVRAAVGSFIDAVNEYKLRSDHK